MTAVSNIPENLNFLSPLNFRFQIKKCPMVNFFIQNVNLPGIALGAPVQPNPFVEIPKPGDHLNYDELMINFKLDEDLQNYLELHNWITQLGFPQRYEQYRTLSGQPVYTGEGVFSDMSLIILTSSKNPNYEVVFQDAFPVSLSSVVFDSTQEDVNHLEAAATFRYKLYTIQQIT